MSDVKIAEFSEYEAKLFGLYTRFRHNELICHDLMRRAGRVEWLVKATVLISVAISLLTGSTSGMNPSLLAPLWAVFGAIATLLAIYSLVVASGPKRFEWFALAARFRTLADEVEFFSEYVKLRKITEDELLVRWEYFSEKLRDLIERGGVEFSDFGLKHADSLQQRLRNALKAEGKTP
jgi:hypothetical protein